ncbi:MAG TPA: nuclear transport factor 2 family protein [Burkholderiales bacterium]|nr:nuclear transport factor 2 family protein [Burkholderiales bacterium]
MTEKEVLALEQKRVDSMLKQDFATLESLLHDQLVYTHSSAALDTKASWLDAMKSGRTKYKSANVTEQKVRIFGDVALVTGRAEMGAEVRGEAKKFNLRFLAAWTKTAQGWKFVAWQSTPLPA